MRLLLITLLLASSFPIFAHQGEYVSIESVEFSTCKDQTTISFDLVNRKQRVLLDLTVELHVNGEVISAMDIESIKDTEGSKRLFFNVSSGSINEESDQIQIEITRLFGKKHDWGGWDNPVVLKQVNTLLSEFYADAPWRMKKTDSNGDLVGIPVHFFLHDADDVVGDVQVDNINIQLKNATDASFNPVLTYNTIPFADFQAMFSCESVFDPALDIKAFNINSFSASSSQTIDFDFNSDIFGEFVAVDENYWYFTFNIPPSDLVGFNDVIDILVTIEYANFSFTDDHIGLRVFRSSTDVPSMPYYYRGDTHLHSMYTQNDAEFGLPLCATKKACQLTGLDWITTTDHTSDFDNYGPNIASNWMRIQDEIQALNAEDNSLIYISGLEIALNNSDSKLVHMLAYPNPTSPLGMPFVGDGDGDIFPTSVTIDDALTSIDTYGGFAYMAHPFSTADELPELPTNGGIWNLNNSDFPTNGSNFPLNGGPIICNDLGLPSDVLSSVAGKLVKDRILGAQIWNTRFNLVASGDENDPWNVQGITTSFAQIDTTTEEFHFRRFRQGQEVVNHINQLGLQLKNSNPNYSNWKLFYSAGTDAHGSFNYSNTGDFAGFGEINNSAVGNLSTVVYCPTGMGTNGEKLLEALKNGHSTLSDGPIATIGLSYDVNTATNEVIMGKDFKLDATAFPNTLLNLDYVTTPEFGDVTRIDFYLGTESGEIHHPISFITTTGSESMSFQLTDLLDDILGVGNTPTNEYMYIRAELTTEIDYATMPERVATYDIFHSVTNPIWFQHYDNVGLEDIDQNFVSAYPNPVENELNIVFQEQTDFDIDVYDQTGRIVAKVNGSGDGVTMNVAHLESGVYYANMKFGSKDYSVKFVKL